MEHYGYIPPRSKRSSMDTQLTKKGHRRKSVKLLPVNFFENLLDLELKLKREFNLGTLKEVINLQSMAIEYYESVDDSRFKDYQARLNNLLSQPEIINKMKEGLGKGGSNKQDESKLAKDKMKHQMKLKVDLVNQSNTYSANEEKILGMVNDINQVRQSNILEDTIVNDIKKQNESFKERLMQRKKKHEKPKLQIKTSDDDLITIKDADAKIELVDEFKKDEIKLENDKEFNDIAKTLDFNNERLSNEIDTEKKFDIDDITTLLGVNKEKLNISHISEKSEDQNNSSKSQEDQTTENKQEEVNVSDLNKKDDSKILSAKYKQLVDDINNNIVKDYIREFNEYFFHHVFQRFLESVQKLMNERFEKYTETCRIYQNQIKEMEFLLNDDDQHKESINLIIESLKEEKQQEIDRMDDHYERLFDEIVLNFKSFGIKSNPGIQLNEEKFKLDVFNLINDLIVPGPKFHK